MGALAWWIAIGACRHPLPPLPAATEAPPPSAPLPIVDGLVGEPSGTCGVFEDFGETATYPALADRYQITLPADAVAQAREPDSIMAAYIPSEREARFVIDRGDSRMVVMVFETYGDAVDDLATTIAASETNEATVARTQVSGLPAAFVEPIATWGPPGGVLVGSGWYDGPDGTVVNVWVLTTPDVAANPADCRAVARRVLTSLSTGAAHLDLAGGARDLEGFEVQLPPRYVLTTERGVDYRLYRIFPVVALTAQTPELGLYFGDHPSFEPFGAEVHGELLGGPVVWYANEQEGWTQRDALVATGEGGAVVHVFVSAPDPAALEALVAIAETLRRTP